MARSAVEKLNTSRQEEEEATDTASEGEGEETVWRNFHFTQDSNERGDSAMK